VTCLWLGHLRSGVIYTACGERGVGLAYLWPPLRPAVGIGWYRIVLVEAADHEDHVVRQRDRRRVPARVLLVGGFRGLSALLIARIAALEELRVRVAREK